VGVYVEGTEDLFRREDLVGLRLEETCQCVGQLSFVGAFASFFVFSDIFFYLM